MVRTRVSTGPDGLVPVADLLTREGHPAPPSDLPARPLRRRGAVVLLSSVIAAGLLISGAVAISNSGRAAPVAGTDTGLFEQLIGGPPGGPYPQYPAGPTPDQLGPVPQRVGEAYPSGPAGSGRTGPGFGTAGSGAVVPPAGASPSGAPAAGAGTGAPVVGTGPATGGTGTGSAARGTGGVPAGSSTPTGSSTAGPTGNTGTGSGTTGGTGSAVAPTPAPAAPADEDDDGLVGNVVDGLSNTVGGLLGG